MNLVRGEAVGVQFGDVRRQYRLVARGISDEEFREHLTRGRCKRDTPRTVSCADKDAVGQLAHYRDAIGGDRTESYLLSELSI